MFQIAQTLQKAIGESRARLSSGVTDALAIQTTANGRDLEGAMARVGERELFTEALVSAAHSHFEEIKTVASK